jgi:peptidoglycan glycosyltransferase
MRTPRAARLTPLLIAAAVAFAGGTYAGARHEDDGRRQVREFTEAWARGDFPAMYRQLSADARRRATLKRFARTYLTAKETLTLQTVVPGNLERDDAGYTVPVALRTQVFGTLSGPLTLPVSEGEEGGIEWRGHHVFPGMRPGQELTRTSELAPRGDLLARDGTVLASGEARTGDAGPSAADIVGRVGPIPPERAAELSTRGVPPGSLVGLTGLEREFDARLTGTPGGELKLGGATLARARPEQGRPVRTSIDLRVQDAAVTALAGRFGGIAVMHPRTGEILALAGIAFSAPQPPGSTFKIVTLSGALEHRVVKRTATFPVQTSTTLSGVELQNADEESCGGTLKHAFAHSCNTVYAPLGAKLGAERLVATAQRFGFNADPPLIGAARSTLPPPAEIGDDLAVGSTAIGQGKVLATPLQMASIAATIGNRGERAHPTLLRGERRSDGRAISARTARTVGQYMRAVVTDGTGTLAAIPGGAVAGKTGTAELKTTQPTSTPTPQPGEEAAPPEEDTADTDAWFVAFAPYAKPRVAIAVLLVGNGRGGDTAAPTAREVLLAALKR